MELLYYFIVSLLSWFGRLIVTPIVIFPILDTFVGEERSDFFKKWFDPLFSFKRRNEL